MPSPAIQGFPLALRASARDVVIEPGTTIFRQGDAAHSVYFVESGVVHLVRFGRSGEEVVLHEAQAGEFFAEASLDSLRYHCDAVAQGRVKLLQIPAGALRVLLDTDAVFSRAWVSMLAQQLRAVRTRVERLSLKSASERVRHLLVSQGRGAHCEVALPGTLKQLAHHLGLTHETLYRTLASMEREGIIVRSGTVLRFTG